MLYSTMGNAISLHLFCFLRESHLSWFVNVQCGLINALVRESNLIEVVGVRKGRGGLKMAW